MRKYSSLGLASLIATAAGIILVLTFYPNSGSAIKQSNPPVETAISQPTMVVQPGMVDVSTALVSALKAKDVGRPGVGRMDSLPQAVYVRLMERQSAATFATGDAVGYDKSVDLKTPVWLVVFVGNGMTSEGPGIQPARLTQMIVIVDAKTGMPGLMTAKAPSEELDLSTFTKVPIPAEYVPPVYDEPPANPTPVILDPPPTRAEGYPVPGQVARPSPYPAPKPTQP